MGYIEKEYYIWLRNEENKIKMLLLIIQCRIYIFQMKIDLLIDLHTGPLTKNPTNFADKLFDDFIGRKFCILIQI